MERNERLWTKRYDEASFTSNARSKVRHQAKKAPARNTKICTNQLWNHHDTDNMLYILDVEFLNYYSKIDKAFVFH